MKLFPKEIYQERRRKLRQLMGKGTLIFMGNEESSINFKDNWYPFRQDSSFLYFFGLSLPGLTALIDLEEDKEVLFGDDVSVEDTVWFGSVPSLSCLAEFVGVKTVRSKSDLPTYLGQLAHDRVHLLPAYRPESRFKISEWFHIPVPQVDRLVSERFIQAVVSLRSIKNEEEIVEINEAVNLSVNLHRKVMQYAGEGMYEYELVGLVMGGAASAGAALSFPPIITTRGQILHNHDYSNKLASGGMLLADFGVEGPSHYAGDITRTIPVGKSFSSQQQEVYQLVLDAYQLAAKELRPGVFFKDIHLMACTRLAEGLKAMGLMKGNMQDAVEAGAHAMFFQCGLGHMMGLDVHDMEDLGEEYVGYTDTLKKSKQFGLKSLRLGKQLEAGFVVTVEPGLYFIPQLMDQWQAAGLHTDFICYDKLKHFRDFGGIRVEDAYLVTSDGSEILGDALEIELRDVEGLRTS